MIEMHRRLALLGPRAAASARATSPLWVAGTATLSLAKILENMEIGHNVMHGQWDWMNDPDINSSTWDWDTASTAEAWKHSHNYVHHTYTNIRGKDKDLGYEIMRIDPHQKWHPVYLAAAVLQPGADGASSSGASPSTTSTSTRSARARSPRSRCSGELKGIAGKARSQIVKDYIAFPALSALIMAIAATRARARRSEGRWEQAKRRARRRPEPRKSLLRPTFMSTLTANVTANVVRNVWAYAIIFCGHFPDQTYTFSQEEVEDETTRRLVRAPADRRGQHRGQPALPRHQRQPRLPGRAPPLPGHAEHPLRARSRRGCEEICERYELPYNTGPFLKQLGMVQRTILRLAFPGGKPRPKPGPYKGEKIKGSGEQTDRLAAAA